MINNNENETINDFTGEKKSGNKGIIGIVIALVLVLAVGVTAFAAKDKIVNLFRKEVASPVDYYHSVEKDSFNGVLDTYMKSYEEIYKLIQSDSMGSDVSLKVELADDVTTMLAAIYPALGDLKSAEVTLDYGLIENAFSLSLGAKLNDANIITGNAYIDGNTSEIYAQVPEISESYLNFSSALAEDDTAVMSRYFSSLSTLYESVYPAPETMETLFKSYVELCIDSTKTVTKESKTLKANGVEEKATALTVKMTGTEIYDLLVAIINKAETDETLNKLIEGFLEYANSLHTEEGLDTLTFDDYKNAIAEAKTSLEALKEDFTKYTNFLTMVVYVNNDGDIIGREITLDDTAADNQLNPNKFVISSKKAIDGNKMGYEMAFLNNDDVVFDIKGSGSASLTEFAGEYVLSVPSEELTVTAKIENCNISNLLAGEFKGDITITTDYELLSTYELKLALDTTLKTANMKVEIAGSDMNFGSITLVTTMLDEVTANKPADTTTVIDITDTTALQEYIAGFNPEEFVNNAATAAGINITYEELITLFSSLNGSSF